MKYRLRHPHTHAGKQYAAGDEIEIDQATADWLDQRHAEREAAALPAPPDVPEGGVTTRPVTTTDGKVIPPTLGNTARPVTTEERKK